MAPHADVTVEFPDLNLNWSGHGYCDSNEGDEPLENPFYGWNWAKAHLEDDTVLVFYDIKQKKEEKEFYRCVFSQTEA